MSTLNFLYIGWCKTESKTGAKSDKVWTAFKVRDSYYAGWGARGKAISFKKHSSRQELERVIRQKEKKYNEVDTFQLFTVFPYFAQEVEQRLTFCLLTNNIR
jgi:hypothetical protein